MDAVCVVDMDVPKSFQYIFLFVDNGAIAIERCFILLQHYMTSQHLQLGNRVHFLKPETVAMYLVYDTNGIRVRPGQGVLRCSITYIKKEKKSCKTLTHQLFFRIGITGRIILQR